MRCGLCSYNIGTHSKYPPTPLCKYEPPDGKQILFPIKRSSSRPASAHHPRGGVSGGCEGTGAGVGAVGLEPTAGLQGRLRGVHKPGGTVREKGGQPRGGWEGWAGIVATSPPPPTHRYPPIHPGSGGIPPRWGVPGEQKNGVNVFQKGALWKDGRRPHRPPRSGPSDGVGMEGPRSCHLLGGRTPEPRLLIQDQG